VDETIDDQINKRGGLAVHELSESRLARKRKAQLALTCVWCGCAVEDADLNAYYPGAHVFCSGECRWAYCS
jgi:hypothetical protein